MSSKESDPRTLSDRLLSVAFIGITGLVLSLIYPSLSQEQRFVTPPVALGVAYYLADLVNKKRRRK